MKRKQQNRVRRMAGYFLLLTFAVIALVTAARIYNGFTTAPANVGRGGPLADCPGTPNCVSTSSSEVSTRIEPITLRTSPAAAIEDLSRIVLAMPRSRIVTSSANYLHAEFRSRFFGFVDDVEFWVDDGQGEVAVRAAARVGRSDLGVNRKRVEQIRKSYMESRDRGDET